MSIYYKFRSAKDYNSLTIDGFYISVTNLKERIFDSKRFGRGNDFDLIVSNAQTNEEYLDESILIPRNTSVLIRRVPGLPRRPIIVHPVKSKVDIGAEQIAKDNSIAAPIDDDFGDEIYVTVSELTSRLANVVMQESIPLTSIENSVYNSQAVSGSAQGREFARREDGERGFGRGFGLQHKTPPQGYICHRCNIPGHYIQHCPTNGDPNFDFQKVKPAIGVTPNESAFDKQLEGVSSNRSTVELPPELHCPLCNKVMKDAVFTSKCCYQSFCDKCIRDYIISKSMCFCEAKNILADDLLPNTTVRDTINRILESDNFCVVGQKNMTIDKNEATSGEKTITGICDGSNATPNSATVKEQVSQKGTLPVEEARQKLSAGDVGKKRKRITPSPGNGAGMHGTAVERGMNGYAELSNFCTHSYGMQPQMNGYNGAYTGDSHRHQSSRSHQSSRPSLVQFTSDIPRPSLKRKAEHGHDHGYDNKPRGYHQWSKSDTALGYEPKRPCKKMVLKETWLGAANNLIHL